MRGDKHEPIEVQKAAGAAQGPLEHLGLLGPEVGFQDGLHPGALGGREQFRQVFHIGVGHEHLHALADQLPAEEAQGHKTAHNAQRACE